MALEHVRSSFSFFCAQPWHLVDCIVSHQTKSVPGFQLARIKTRETQKERNIFVIYVSARRNYSVLRVLHVQIKPNTASEKIPPQVTFLLSCEIMSHQHINLSLFFQQKLIAYILCVFNGGQYIWQFRALLPLSNSAQNAGCVRSAIPKPKRMRSTIIQHGACISL